MAAPKTSTATGHDVATCLTSFQTDLLLEVRQTLTPAENGCVEIHTVVWREVESVKIGVYQANTRWTPSGIPLTNALMWALHKAYWAASDLAHSGSRPKWAQRNGH